VNDLFITEVRGDGSDVGYTIVCAKLFERSLIQKVLGYISLHSYFHILALRYILLDCSLKLAILW